MPKTVHGECLSQLLRCLPLQWVPKQWIVGAGMHLHTLYGADPAVARAIRKSTLALHRAGYQSVIADESCSLGVLSILPRFRSQPLG